MIGDYNQLLRIGRLILVSSNVDRPEFARALGRQRNKFYFTVCAIRCKLALAPLGLRVRWTGVIEFARQHAAASSGTGYTRGGGLLRRSW